MTHNFEPLLGDDDADDADVDVDDADDEADDDVGDATPSA